MVRNMSSTCSVMYWTCYYNLAHLQFLNHISALNENILNINIVEAFYILILFF